MSDHRDSKTNGPADGMHPQDDTEVAMLLSLAGARPAIPASLRDRVHERVEREWLAATASRRAARWAVPTALAASLVVAVTLVIDSGGPPPLPVGTVARVVGGNAGQASIWTAGRQVRVGDTVRTAANQRISIELDAGGSLRLGEATVLQLASNDVVKLESGMAYADSGPESSPAGALVIHTEFGTVSDIGTQFLVQVNPDHLEVAVREGIVDIAAEGASYSITAGDKVTIREDRAAEFGTVSPTDESWNWAVEIAPGFEMQNKTLFEFLEWAARETGRALLFSSDEVLNLTRSTTLYGDVRGFTPDEAIESVLATTSIRCAVEATRIVVGDQ